MRVLICGGRDFDDLRVVEKVLDGIHAETPITYVIEGGAPGADFLGKSWALGCDIYGKTYEAEWAKHGRAAGPIRNAEMLADGKPDLVVAFPGGRGTADMVSRAKRAGVRVIEVSKDGTMSEMVTVTRSTAFAPTEKTK